MRGTLISNEPRTCASPVDTLLSCFCQIESIMDDQKPYEIFPSFGPAVLYESLVLGLGAQVPVDDLLGITIASISRGMLTDLTQCGALNPKTPAWSSHSASSKLQNSIR
jgi:hypothetical protein